MSAGSNLLRSIWRAILALLLTFAVVSPALAEIGCFEDSIEHAQAEERGSAGGAGLDQSAPEPNGDGSRDQTTHCAFSHGAHGFAIAAGSSADSPHDLSTQEFVIAVDRRRPPLVRDGPERPPQA